MRCPKCGNYQFNQAPRNGIPCPVCGTGMETVKYRNKRVPEVRPTSKVSVVYQYRKHRETGARR